MRQFFFVASFFLSAALVAQAQAPEGIRVKWGGVTSDSCKVAPAADHSDRVLIPWSTSEQGLKDLLYAAPAKFCSGALSCSDDKVGGRWCSLGIDPYPGWYADFGDHTFNLALDLYENRFYRAVARIEMEYFDFALETLTLALGDPVITEAEVQNQMGAKFASVTAAWKAGDVDVELVGRGWDVQTAAFRMSYRPLASKVPTKPKAGSAPF